MMQLILIITNKIVPGINSEIASAAINERSNTILPNFGIMAVIEQLGETYISNRVPQYGTVNQNVSPLKKGLYYFGNNLNENYNVKERDMAVKSLVLVMNQGYLVLVGWIRGSQSHPFWFG